MSRGGVLLIFIFLFTLVLLYGHLSRKIESFVSPVEELISQINDQETSEEEIQNRIQDDAVEEANKTKALRSDTYDITREVNKANCLNLAQFETISTSNLTFARHERDSMLLQKSYHKGEWDEDRDRCINTVSEGDDIVNCSQTQVECADSNSDELSLRMGRQHSNMSNICVFDNCPVYCLSYGENCWELKSNQQELFFQQKRNARTNCVDASDENMGNCLDPVVDNCPNKLYYFYDSGVIRSNMQSISLSSDHKCTYTKPSHTMTFDTLEEAQSNCAGMNTTKICYLPNGSGEFSRTEHSLDRSVCGYPSEPSECMEYSQLSCADSPEYFSVGSSSYDSVAGVFRKTFSSSASPSTLEVQSDGSYKCVHSQPADSFRQSELASQCRASCFLGDGTPNAIMKSGTVNSYNECVISDCHETSQQMDVSSCPAENYYYYGGDNSTIRSSPKTKEVNAFNQCTYTIPGDAPRPNFETRSSAEANCSGSPLMKTCQYTDSDGNVSNETHNLNRENCSYTGERSGCSSGITAGTDCPGSTTYYKVNDDAVYSNGSARKTVSSVTVSHQLSATPGSAYSCEAQSAPSGFEDNPTCTIDCYTAAGGANTQTIGGIIDQNECIVSSGCYDTDQSTPSTIIEHDTIAGYTFDDGTAYGIAAEDLYKMYYKVDLSKQGSFAHVGKSSAQECADECDQNCDCIAFSYYPVGGSSTDPSKNCYTIHLPREDTEMEIKESSRPSSSAMRHVYQKDIHKTSMSTVHRNGKYYIKDIPLVSNSICTPVDCAESATYYKLDAGSYDDIGNYQYNVLSTIVSQVAEGTVCVDGSVPSGYGSRPANCSQTCFSEEGGAARTVTGIVSGTSCTIRDCHENEQVVSSPVEECDMKTVYKLDDTTRVQQYHGADGGYDKGSAILLTQTLQGTRSTNNECEYVLPSGFSDDKPECILNECRTSTGVYSMDNGVETCEVERCFVVPRYED